MKNKIVAIAVASFAVISTLAVADDANSNNNVNVFTGSNAITAVSDAIIKSGAATDVKVHINEVRDEDVIISAPESITAEVDDLNLDKAHNKWQAKLLLKSAGSNLAPVALAGRYDEMAQIPVLKHQIKTGEVISQDDVELSRIPTTNLRKATITDIKSLIGKSPKHAVSEGRPIRMEEIAMPAILNKGAHITLVYKSPNIEIRTIGEALDSGAKGDVIRVRNLTSKAVIDGTVESADRVRVSSPDTNSAEAM